MPCPLVYVDIKTFLKIQSYLKRKKYFWGFLIPKICDNFCSIFHKTITSSINFLFLKSVTYTRNISAQIFIEQNPGFFLDLQSCITICKAHLKQKQKKKFKKILGTKKIVLETRNWKIRLWEIFQIKVKRL